MVNNEICVCTNDQREKIFNELKSGTHDLLAEFYTKHPQMKLYKYRFGANRDLDALRENKLWIGCAANMDDDFDSAFVHKKSDIKRYKAACGKDPTLKEERVAKLFNAGGKVFQKDLYVCSLAETPFNEDLWARYANDYAGFCIEYSAHALMRAKRLPFPVFYGNIKGSLFDYSGKSKEYAVFGNVLKKDKALWEQQGEWRIIDLFYNLNIPSGSKGKLIDVPPPTKLFCGRFASNELKNELAEIAKTIGIPIEYV